MNVFEWIWAFFFSSSPYDHNCGCFVAGPRCEMSWLDGCEQYKVQTQAAFICASLLCLSAWSLLEGHWFWSASDRRQIPCCEFMCQHTVHLTVSIMATLEEQRSPPRLQSFSGLLSVALMQLMRKCAAGERQGELQLAEADEKSINNSRRSSKTSCFPDTAAGLTLEK